MFAKAFQAGLDRVGEQPVIAVQKHNRIADAAAQSGITSRRNTLVTLTKIDNLRIGTRYLLRAIGRPIVYDEEFNPTMRLGEYTLNCFVKIVTSIEARDHNGHQFGICSVHRDLHPKVIASLARVLSCQNKVEQRARAR